MRKILLFCYLSAKEYILLYHFLKHYKKLGVTEFHLTIDCHNDENLKQRAGEITKDYNTVNTFVNKYNSNLKQDAVNKFINNNRSDSNWLVYVDLDEFINLENSIGIDCKNLIELGEYLNSLNILSIRAYMFDKVNPEKIDTTLRLDVDISETLSHYYPVCNNIRRRLNYNKSPFFLGTNEPIWKGSSFFFKGSNGSQAFKAYYKSEKYQSLCKNKFIVLDHYKWHKDSIKKLKERLLIYKDNSPKVRIYNTHLSELKNIIKNGYEKDLLTKNITDPKNLHPSTIKKDFTFKY
jgi:hypothetical protein